MKKQKVINYFLINPPAYKGDGKDATPHKVFLQFFQDDFSLEPTVLAVGVSLRHISTQVW